MAGIYNGAVVTNAGLNLFAQAVTASEITWTHGVTSSYAIPAGTNIQSLTSLQDIKQTVDISYATVINSDTVQVSARFTNEGVATAYNIQAIGIYAKVGSGSEVLVAVVTAQSPDEQSADSGSSLASHIFSVQMVFSNASQVTMNVIASGSATIADVNLLRQELVTEINLKADTSVLQALDTPVRVSIAVGDWAASGSNWTVTKACAKASTADWCVLKIAPVNPSSLTASELKTLQKNISYLYPRPTVGNGTITFLAAQKPTITLTFDVVGGAVT